MTQVHVSKLTLHDGENRAFGFCVDIGAPKSVIGREELERTVRRKGLQRPKLTVSQRRFRFADTMFKSVGKVKLYLATPPGVPPLPVLLNVVDANIPVLLGLDFLNKESLTADAVVNRLKKRTPVRLQDGTYKFSGEWSMRLKRAKSKYVYIEMGFSTNMYFTRAQPVKLHKQFFHPSA